MLVLLVPGVGMGGGAASAPIFSGTIPNISHTENTGTHSYDLGAYFTGATSYSISPAVETGWSFNTTTGELVIDTDDVSVFGPYVVTGTNLAGSADSNSFSVTVVAAAVEGTGGWEFIRSYEYLRSRRLEEERKRQRLEEETEQIPDTVDRQIAQLLREQEAIDARREELTRLKALVQENADLEAARRYSERVAKALEAAIQKGTVESLDRLEKALRKAREEEERVLLETFMAVLH